MIYRSICMALAILLLAACSSDKDNKNLTDGAPVRVSELRMGSMPRMLQAVGNVKASATVGLVPRVAGEIVKINFTEGQDVIEGQPLIQIDPRPYQAALKEKKGQLAKSEAQLAKALEDRRRYAKLVNSGYVSREAYEQTATDAASLRATVLSDRAALENAELDLAYCTLTAPISGRIGALSVDKGNMVKSGDSDPIVTIDAISPCYVTFSVPEIWLSAIQNGMANGSVPLTATPTGGEPREGSLTLVDNNVDTKTGTIRLRATFANEPRYLWPGQFVQIGLPLEKVENVLVAPSRAVQTGRDGSFVYVVGPDNRAEYRKVKVMLEHEGLSVLEGDLNPGQQIIIDGIVRLAPGSPLKIMEKVEF